MDPLDELLRSLSAEELEDELNWVRTREKQMRHDGKWGLYWYWRHHGLAIVLAITRAYQVEVDSRNVQLSLTDPAMRLMPPDERL